MKWHVAAWLSGQVERTETVGGAQRGLELGGIGVASVMLDVLMHKPCRVLIEVEREVNAVRDRALRTQRGVGQGKDWSQEAAQNIARGAALFHIASAAIAEMHGTVTHGETLRSIGH